MSAAVPPGRSRGTQRAARSADGPAIAPPSCGDSRPSRSAPRFLSPPRGRAGAAPRPRSGEKGRGDGAGRPRPPPAPRPPQAALQGAFAIRSSGSTAAGLPRSAPHVYSRLARAARAAAPPGRSEPFKIKSRDRARIVVGSTWTASKGKSGVVPEPSRGDLEFVPSALGRCPSPAWGKRPIPGREHRTPRERGCPSEPSAGRGSPPAVPKRVNRGRLFSPAALLGSAPEASSSLECCA